MPAGHLFIMKTLHPGSRFKSVYIRSFLCQVFPRFQVPGSRFQVPGSRFQVIPGDPR